MVSFKDFFDSGSNVSMTQRSVLPKNIITKFLGDTKLVKTLAGHLKMHKVVTTQDQRLPKFDKTGASNLLLVLVFDNDDLKYDIILSTTCYPRLDSSQTAQKETWNGLISPTHFVHRKVQNSNKFDAMEHMFHIQLKDKIFGED